MTISPASSVTFSLKMEAHHSCFYVEKLFVLLIADQQEIRKAGESSRRSVITIISRLDDKDHDWLEHLFSAC